MRLRDAEHVHELSAAGAGRHYGARGERGHAVGGQLRSLYVRQRPDDSRRAIVQYSLNRSTESHMYIGGGILGTILILLLIVYFVRRV
jgi:hypothetical protein